MPLSVEPRGTQSTAIQIGGVLVPAALGLSPVLAVRVFFSCVLSGCHSGSRAFWRFFGFSRNIGGV